ncbi:vanadium-dependent haloperoxidase [Lentibacillus saliphilus]|uniref:vanadium-dependent haloperoxidase n=1 Tax=Lentibacillus saliphilus TaxID=2737028 RepID=UPI001FE974B6|nr:vanadium-dependent haloperoxidase [Lentibacillus saliphilus]
MSHEYLKWSETVYGGEKQPPNDPVDPLAGSWPMYYFTKDEDTFNGPDGRPVHFDIQSPDTIDWYRQLRAVNRTLKHLTPHQRDIAIYWGTGAATKQWTPVVDRLIDTYNLTPTRAARVLAAVHTGINDTFVIVWHYKYLWNVARPIQYDQSIETVVCTPRFPTYISGHAAVAGYVETILSYFFPGEARHLKQLAEENAKSRLYAGVHFPIDNDEGLSLGRQIGHFIIKTLSKEHNEKGQQVDVFYRKNLRADISPQPYEQVIPFDFDNDCTSNTITSIHDGKHSKYVPKPKLYL